MKYHSVRDCVLTRETRGPWLVGSLSGADASQKVTEARNGSLTRDGNPRASAKVWHLDVGSSHPGAGVGPKGWAVRPLKRHASWVQNVVRQFGLYPLRAPSVLRGADLSTRGPDWTDRWWSSCGTTCRLRSYVRKQEPLKASKWEMHRKMSTLTAVWAGKSPRR